MASCNKELNDLVLKVVLDELSDDTYVSQNDLVPELVALNRRRPAVLLGTARIGNYVEETVPRYSDPLFRAHFRMTRTSFQLLLELIGPHAAVPSISLERRTLACLWYLSNQETFRSVADYFGLSKGSLHYYLGNFCSHEWGKCTAVTYFLARQIRVWKNCRGVCPAGRISRGYRGNRWNLHSNHWAI